jgi:hypothetical protein
MHVPAEAQGTPVALVHTAAGPIGSRTTAHVRPVRRCDTLLLINLSFAGIRRRGPSQIPRLDLNLNLAGHYHFSGARIRTPFRRTGWRSCRLRIMSASDARTPWDMYMFDRAPTLQAAEPSRGRVGA